MCTYFTFVFSHRNVTKAAHSGPPHLLTLQWEYFYLHIPQCIWCTGMDPAELPVSKSPPVPVRADIYIPAYKAWVAPAALPAPAMGRCFDSGLLYRPENRLIRAYRNRLLLSPDYHSQPEFLSFLIRRESQIGIIDFSVTGEFETDKLLLDVEFLYLFLLEFI